MRRFLLCCVLGLGISGAASALPPDVRPGHWAAAAVDQALANGVMSLDSDHRFHGEARVTREQAVIALAKLAQTVEANRWQDPKSVPIPATVVSALKQGDWKQRPVTRYILASVLTRYGSYVSHGVNRAPTGSPDTGKSELVPPAPKIKISKNHAAYASLAYLAEHREIWPGSPLLSPSNQPVKGMELSRAVKELVIGLNNRLTALGLDASGSTPDASFHKKKP